MLVLEGKISSSRVFGLVWESNQGTMLFREAHSTIEANHEAFRL